MAGNARRTGLASSPITEKANWRLPDSTGSIGDVPAGPSRGVSRAAILVALVAGALAAASCGGSEAPAPAGDDVRGEISVFAAASLTDAFKEAAKAFESQHPGAHVTFNFASSSALATQINEGAPAELFASADQPQMKVVADSGNLAGNALTFATNRPVVIVPKRGSPVSSFADLAKQDVRLVLAGPEVPIGKYAREIFANASKAGGVAPDFEDKALANLKSNEANVRAVLAKVQLGEADAGVVYATDAAIAANDVTVIEVPAVFNVVAQYPIAALKQAKNAPGARAWVAFVTSAEGQAILAKYGFGRP